MKEIDAIIIHCSATRAGQDLEPKILTGCTGLGDSIKSVITSLLTLTEWLRMGDR